MPRSSPPSRPTGVRRHLTLQQKVLIIDKREREGLKQDALARWAAAEFALPTIPTQPTISNILKDKDRLRDALRRHPHRGIKSVREVTCPQFEEAIVQWIRAQTTAAASDDADPKPLDRRAVLEYASVTRNAFPRASDLALSEGWLSQLLKRRAIRLRPTENDPEDEREEEEAKEEEERRDEELEPTLAPVLVPTPQRSRPNRSASPAWSDTASPVYTSPPVCSRVTRTLPTVTSNPPSPLALRSLAQAATPRLPRANDASTLHQQVGDYYGSHLKTTQDLRTNASAFDYSTLPSSVRKILNAIPEAVTAKFYGCGFPIPLGIQGLDVLDLGCGSGRDAYVLSALVGPNGWVTGVDMTPPLLQIAQQNVAAFTNGFHPQLCARLEFVQGYIESLDQAGIESEAMDLVISNFAMSLVADKKRMLHDVFRVLRTGGEFQFSDIYASRRVPTAVQEHAVLYCEGLGGAVYLDDLKALCHEVGFGEPRLIRRTPVTIVDETLATSVATIQYESVTLRCFKVEGMEMRATEEDYGHVAKYLGTIPGHEGAYDLDVKYRFETRRPVRVGGNTAAILKSAWLAKYFEVAGDGREHFGRFTRSPRPT